MDKQYYNLFLDCGPVVELNFCDLDEAISVALTWFNTDKIKEIDRHKLQTIEIRPIKTNKSTPPPHFSSNILGSYYLDKKLGLLNHFNDVVNRAGIETCGIENDTWIKINELIVKNNKKKQRYNVFKRVNGVAPFGLFIQSTFKEVINYCSDKVFHGNDLIEFEIRPVNCGVENNHYLPYHRQSAYLVKENDKPVIKCFRFSMGAAQGCYDMTAQEIDEWDNKFDNKENIEQEELRCEQSISEEILPPIEEINKHNPVELTLLLEEKEIVNLLILLNFIKPINPETEEYFDEDLIYKIKCQCRDHLLNK